MVVLFCVALGLLVLYIFLRRDTKKRNQIPGPKGWPLVGCAPYLKKRQTHEVYADFAGQFGDIFKLNVFGQSVIVLNTAKLIRAAFSGEKYKKHMNDRTPTFYGEHFLWGHQSIAFIVKAYGSDHDRLRKVFFKGMHVYGEGRKEFEDRVKSELASLVDLLKTRVGTDVDLTSVLKRSLTNVMSIILGGHVLKDDDKDINMVWDFEECNDFFIANGVNLTLSLFPFLRFVPGVYRNAFKKMQEAKQTILQRYFYDKKPTYKPGEIRGLVDFLISLQLEAQKDGSHVIMTDIKIMAMLLETITAGIATSLSSISNLFLCLLNHPECQTKIQDELDRVIGMDRLPTIADKHMCPFTDAVIIEAQRYINTGPLGLPHLCIDGMEFEGYEIPPNSMIVANLWYIHHDEKIWGDPWNFRPERWLDESGELLPNDHKVRRKWLSFGAGRRQCPAEGIARSWIFLYVATLLQRCDLEMTPGHSVSCDPRHDSFNINSTIRPKPYKCRFTPRTPACN